MKIITLFVEVIPVSCESERGSISHPHSGSADTPPIHRSSESIRTKPYGVFYFKNARIARHPGTQPPHADRWTMNLTCVILLSRWLNFQLDTYLLLVMICIQENKVEKYVLPYKRGEVVCKANINIKACQMSTTLHDHNDQSDTTTVLLEVDATTQCSAIKTSHEDTWYYQRKYNKMQRNSRNRTRTRLSLITWHRAALSRITQHPQHYIQTIQT